MKPTVPSRSADLAQRPLTLSAAMQCQPARQQPPRGGRSVLQILQPHRASTQLSLFPPPYAR